MRLIFFFLGLLCAAYVLGPDPFPVIIDDVIALWISLKLLRTAIFDG